MNTGIENLIELITHGILEYENFGGVPTTRAIIRIAKDIVAAGFKQLDNDTVVLKKTELDMMLKEKYECGLIVGMEQAKWGKEK